jgi:DNA-binding SARP family transcriptional activator
MNRPRDREVLQGFAALVGLLAGLAGVPAGLVALGQGLPTTLPSAHAVSSWWRSPVTDSSLLRGVTLVCWLVWGLFVVAVLVEMASRWSTRRLKIRIPGLQGVAATLVVSVLMLMPQRAMPVDAGAPLAARLAVATSPAQTMSLAPVAAADPVRVEEPVPPSAVRYVVQRYDSPWRIAERHLGDGTRWREILDEKGQTLVRSGTGSRIIYPGEVFLLPADAAIPPAVECPVPAPAPAAPVPQPAVVPPPLPPAPAPPVMHAIPDGAIGGSPPHAVLDITTARHRQDHGSHADAQTLLEAGVLSAAILGTIRTLRRRQAQHRLPGRRIRLPDGELAPTERALRLSEEPELVETIDRAMHALAADLRRADTTPPSIVGVLATADLVEVLLDRPAPPPPTWTAAAEGFRWRALPAELPPVDSRVSVPMPALVPVGRAAGSGAEVLLNLETAGMLAITGDRTRAAGMAHAMAVGLACVPWAAAINVTLLGYEDALAPIERVRHVGSIGEVMAELRSTAKVMTDVLGEQGCVDAFDGRVRGLAGDGWPPTIVVCGRPLSGDELAALAEVTRPGSGVVAVVLAGKNQAPWVIDVDSSPMPVDPLRLAVEPNVLSDELLARVGALLEAGRDETGSTLGEPPYDRVSLTAERDQPTPDPAVLVRVLGTVEVDNAAEFKRPKSKELLVYLAMHPHGVGEAELDEAMWPSDGSRVVQASTRDSTVSVARTAVGGPSRLLPAQVQGREKRYQVSGEVSSDWALFCGLHRRGRATRDVVPLRQALELVRGRPFDGVIAGRTYGWVHSEGHARHIEAEVGDAADLLAELCLEKRDARGARWAARRGLLAEPYAERLWVRLMEAADQLGESQEVERVMDEMDAVLELGGDFSMLHPNTLDAYRRFSRRESSGVNSSRSSSAAQSSPRSAPT